MSNKNYKQFETGIYKRPNDPKHYVEVTIEGIIVCYTTNGLGILCDYPYIEEYCDDCPLKTCNGQPVRQ